MARRIPEDRFDALVRGATGVFIERGYRLTQMADVAKAIGVAKGTLYGYVESKEALLTLCLECADAAGPIPLPETLPMATPAPGALGQRVEDALAAGIRIPELEAAVARDAPVEGDAADEARVVVAELFDLMDAHRHAIKLLDRCLDHPEIRGLWQTQGREGLRVALGRYVERRTAAGHFRVFPDVRLASRFVIECCATWAVHIRWDRAPEDYDPEAARANVIEFVVRGLVA